MANEEQLSILKKGVDVWNRWRESSPKIKVDLRAAYVRKGYIWEGDFKELNLSVADLSGVDLREANLREANLDGVRFNEADLTEADLSRASLKGANFSAANLYKVNLSEAHIVDTNVSESNLAEVNFNGAQLVVVNLTDAHLRKANFTGAIFGGVVLGNNDLGSAVGLDEVQHRSASTLGTDTIQMSRGKIPESFLRGCGLSDWEIESAKLYDPGLSNEEINKVLYKIYDLRASQALQLSHLFVSYSHEDRVFVDKLENQLNEKGIRFWRDIHDMKAGRMEKQIDQAIRQNPTVLLVLSEHSLSSDWVEHEVRMTRRLEKDMGRDVLCPVALDDSWKSSLWPKRVMEQIMEYNILDFSAWENDRKFDGMFRRLIDGLELFYKG